MMSRSERRGGHLSGGTTISRTGLDRGPLWAMVFAVLVGVGTVGSRAYESTPLLGALGVLPFVLIAVLWGRAQLGERSKDVFTIAFILRVGVALFLGFVFLAQDEVILHRIASDLRCCDWSLWSNRIRSGDGYVLLIAGIYAITGPNIFMAKLFNAVIGSLLPFIARRAAQGLWNNPVVAERAFWVTAFLPALVLYSALNLKEMTVAVLLVATIAVLADRELALGTKATLGILLVIATYVLRGAWAIVPASALGYWAVMLPERPLRLRTLTIRVGLALTAAVVLLVPLSFIMEGVLAHVQERVFIGARASFGTLQTATASVTRGLLDVSNPWAPRNVLIQLARTPFTPSPLAWLAGRSFSAFFDSVIGVTLYAVWPFALIGLVSSRDRRTGVIAVPTVVLFFVIAMSLNLGLTISRHGVPLIAPLAILAAQGWEERWSWRILIYGWIAAAGAFSVLYLLFKV